MTHQPVVIRKTGVDPDKKGVQMLRTRTFQGYCGNCGWTGKNRGYRREAWVDVSRHRRETEGGEGGGL